MHANPNGRTHVLLPGGAPVASGAATLASGRFTVGCVCSDDAISAVHAYLAEHFPACMVRDLHAPTKLMREGVLAGYRDYHVMSIAADAPSHVVLLQEFLAEPLPAVAANMCRWDVAHALRVHRIVIVGRDRVTSL